MTIKQLQEQRGKALADASAIMGGETITTEQRAQFDAHMAEVTRIDGDIARLSAIEEHRAAVRNPVNQPTPNPSESADPEERAEVRTQRQKASLRKWMRSGEVESRDLTVANSGVIIPVGFDPEVREAQRSYGDIYNLVTVQKTSNGDPIKMVLDDDTENALVLIGSGAVSTNPNLTGEQLQVSEYTTGSIPVDNALLQDAGFDLEAFIRDKFGKRFFRGASGLIISGDGGNVASLTGTYNAALTVTGSTTGVIKYADLVSVMVALDPAYASDSVWTMNNATLGAVLNIVDGNGRPIFLPNYGSADQGFVGSILGRPVRLVTQLPNVASGSVPVLFGSFKQAYTFRQVDPGLVILRDPYTLMAKNQMAFYGFCRVGGLATLANASIPPVVSLTIK